MGRIWLANSVAGNILHKKSQEIQAWIEIWI